MKNTIYLLMLLAIFPLSFADIGPKPYMDFTLSYSTSNNVNLINGNLYECDDAQCLNATPLMQVGPQHFSCSSDISCGSLAYGYSSYLKLVINFSDRVRESDVFKYMGSGNYDVIVKDSGMTVTASSIIPILPVIPQDNYTKDMWSMILAATIATIVIELIISAAYLWLTKKQMSILMSVALVNIVSVPLLWMIVAQSNNGGLLIGMEIVVFALEGYAIHLLNKKAMPLKDSMVMSLLANLASFLIGMFLVLA